MDYLNYCEQKTAQFISQLLETCWHDLDTRLYERIQAIREPRKRIQQLNMMQEARFKADQAATTLGSQNQLNFLRYRDNLPLRHRDVTAVGAHSAQAALEDSLAINGAISTVQESQRHPLWQINKRMALLRGGIISDERDNPIAPASICLAFQHTVLTLDLDARTRLIIYEAFSKAFRKQSASFYQTTNQYLADAGVLPNLLQTIRPAPLTDSPTKEPNPTRSLANHEQRLDRILQMVSATAQWPDTLAQWLAAPSILPLETYLHALGEVPQSSTGASPQTNLACFQQQLTTHAQRRSAGLNQGLLLVADLITRLFDRLMHHDDMPPMARQLFQALHLPVLGLTLSDRRFFLHPDHPARLLLDAIGYQGTLWQQCRENDQVMAPKMRHIIEKLESAPLGNRCSFEQAWIELDGFLRDKQARAAIRERRCIQSRQGMHSLECARGEASRIVSTSMQSHAVCDDIAKDLHGPCTEFLTFTLLRQGHGKQWDQACKLMEGIAMSVRGQLTSDHVTRFQRGQQRLIKATRSGLTALGYQGLLVQDLMTTLRAAQDRALELLATRQQIAAAPPAPAAKPHQPQQLQHLKRDQWYRIDTANHTAGLTLKLAWRSGAHFLFVDIQGNEAATLDASAASKAWDNGGLRQAKLPPEHITENLLEEFATIAEAQRSGAPALKRH